MAKRGRPRLPVELHIMRGSYRKDRHGDRPPLVSTAATAPALTTDPIPADAVAGLSEFARRIVTDLMVAFDGWDAASLATARAYACSVERLERLQAAGCTTVELARETRINLSLLAALQLERESRS